MNRHEIRFRINNSKNNSTKCPNKTTSNDKMWKLNSIKPSLHLALLCTLIKSFNVTFASVTFKIKLNYLIFTTMLSFSTVD